MNRENICELNNVLLKSRTGIKDRGILLSNETITEDLGIIGIGIKEYVRKEFLHVIDHFNYDKKRLKQLEKQQTLIEIKNVIKLEPVVKRIIGNVDYLTVSKIPIPVPVGMVTDMISALDLLNKAIEVIDKHLIETIDELDTVVSKVIADKDYRSSNRPIKVGKDVAEYNKLLEETLNKIINPSNYEDRRKYEDLYPNIASLKIVFDMLLETSKINNSKTLNKIDKLTKSVSDKIKTLYDLSENIKTFKASKTVVENLTTILEDTSKFVTNSVSIIYLNNQLAGSYTNTIELLDKYS